MAPAIACRVSIAPDHRLPAGQRHTGSYAVRQESQNPSRARSAPSTSRRHPAAVSQAAGRSRCRCRSCSSTQWLAACSSRSRRRRPSGLRGGRVKDDRIPGNPGHCRAVAPSTGCSSPPGVPAAARRGYFSPSRPCSSSRWRLSAQTWVIRRAASPAAWGTQSILISAATTCCPFRVEVV